MRTLLVLATLALLAAPGVAADAAAPEPDVDPDCFQVLTQPWESPVELVFVAAGVVLCIAQ